MADTVRTISQILTLLADNSIGGISASDLRDSIVTLQPKFGGVYVSSSAETTISSSSTYTKVDGTTTLIGESNLFDMPANNRLRYTGPEPISAFIVASVSLQTASGTKDCRLAFHKNGSIVTNSITEDSVSTTSDNIILFGLVELDTNDYVEVFVANETDTVNLTASYMTIGSVGFIK